MCHGEFGLVTPTERYEYQRKLKKAAYFRQYRSERRSRGLDIPVRVGEKVTTEASLARK